VFTACTLVRDTLSLYIRSTPFIPNMFTQNELQNQNFQQEVIEGEVFALDLNFGFNVLL